MKNILFAIIILLLFASCSFNQLFYYTDSEIQKINNPEFTELFLYNKDSVKLNGLYAEPKTRAKGSVILIHGNAGNVSSWVQSLEPLLKNGYRVLVFDYQGYGKSEGHPAHQNVVTDAELFLNYLYQKKRADEKLIAWGVSLGGNLSVNLAYRNPDKIHILIDEAGFSSHNDIATAITPWFIKPFARIGVQSPYSSKKLISQLRIPILIIHSTEDEVVPFKMGKKVFENANDPKIFWAIKSKHCYAIFDYETEFINRLDSLVKSIN